MYTANNHRNVIENFGKTGADRKSKLPPTPRETSANTARQSNKTAIPPSTKTPLNSALTSNVSKTGHRRNKSTKREKGDIENQKPTYKLDRSKSRTSRKTSPQKKAKAVTSLKKPIISTTGTNSRQETKESCNSSNMPPTSQISC